MNNLSFRELSALGSLVAVVVAYTLYFSRVFGVIAGGDVPSGFEILAYGISIVGVLVAIEVAYHIVLGIRFKDEPMDERDRLIAARADQGAYGVLAFGAVLVVGHLLMTDSTVIAAQFLLLAIVLAEIVKYAATIVLYRRST